RRELTGSLPIDVESADQMAFAQERNPKECARPRPQQDVTEGPVIDARYSDVGDLNRLPRHGHAPGDAFATTDRHVPSHRDDLLGEIVRGPKEELLGTLVVLVDRACVGAGELIGPEHDRVEDGVEI